MCIVAVWFTVLFFFLSSGQACENGRGAILLSVARGKVSEGIDFGNIIQWLFVNQSVHNNYVITDVSMDSFY